MAANIVLSADSTCDLGAHFVGRYNVEYFPLHISLGGQLYSDNVDITPEQAFEVYRQTGEMPKTSAVNVGEYLDKFRQWTQKGSEVIHLSLGSGISSSHENAATAAERTPGVHVIDTGNLSTGSGLLVLAAAERIERGMAATQIVEEVKALRSKTHASFIINTMEFLRAGGRCTAMQDIAATFLKIKPCIEVDNKDGSMSMGKKYRGKLETVLLQYAHDKLSEYEGRIDYTRVFITHTAIDEAYLNCVSNYLAEHTEFKEIHETSASTTIGSHCGPGTLGILFMTR